MGNRAMCVAMQPTYLPWLGYFDLIDQSTVIVFLDSVQFAKRSWQQRNQIRSSRGLEWLTVPVRVKGRYHQLIREAEIMQPSSFPHDHIRAIELNYRRAPYFDTYFPKLREILTEAETLLYKLNMQIIRWLTSEIGIGARFELGSVLGAQGNRSELLVDICKLVDAYIYLSPMGSAAYLTKEHQIFQKNNIEVLFHNYNHPEYQQVFQPFIPYASALDLLFNEGDGSLDIIRSGRKESLTLQDILERFSNVRSSH